jgi:hypothetical protein
MINISTHVATHSMRTWENSALIEPGIVTPFMGRCSVFGGARVSAYLVEMPNFDNKGVAPGVRAGSPPV